MENNFYRALISNVIVLYDKERLNTFFYLLQLLRGFLYGRDHKKKEWSSTEQASNETVAKNFGGTFYQIQTENSALSQRIDSKPLTDRIYVFEYSIFVDKT